VALGWFWVCGVVGVATLSALLLPWVSYGVHVLFENCLLRQVKGEKAFIWD